MTTQRAAALSPGWVHPDTSMLGPCCPSLCFCRSQTVSEDIFFKVLSSPIVFRLSTGTPEGHAGRIRGGVGVFVCCLSAPHCPSQLASALPGPYSLQTVSPRWLPVWFCHFSALAEEFEGWRKPRAFLPFIPFVTYRLSGAKCWGCVDKEKGSVLEGSSLSLGAEQDARSSEGSR